jgi:hypothetical protein
MAAHPDRTPAHYGKPHHAEKRPLLGMTVHRTERAHSGMSVRWTMDGDASGVVDKAIRAGLRSAHALT